VEPFDRSMESPIARIRDLQARAPGSVVTEAGMSALQEEAYVHSKAEDRLLELVGSDNAPDLLVISGSAGSGKSALIDRLLGAHPDLFEFVIQDATHSNSPSETQADVLRDFFEPFKDGVAGPPGRPRLIAANIGLVLAFFAALHEVDSQHEFRELEAILKHQLGVGNEEPPEVLWNSTVINLDLRPTAGRGGLLREMLMLADFRNPEGVVGGAPRCDSCKVRQWCPVRTNAILVGGASVAIDQIVSQAAVERGRHDSPRELWDLVSRLVCGDDPFDDEEDPCDSVAAAVDREDRRWVWEHLLPQKLFDTGGDLGARIHELDPSLRPGYRAHRTLASAGVEPVKDAAVVVAMGPGEAEALQIAAEYLEGGNRGVGRALVAAKYLMDSEGWTVGDETSRRFGDLLAEYDEFGESGGYDYPALDELRFLLERAIGCSFGVLVNGKPYVSVKAYDPRDPSLVFVSAELRHEEGIYEVPRDPARTRDTVGAYLAGHRPLAVTVVLGGMEVAITLPVFRLLVAAARGTLASTADLERFYGLRRAVESLSRKAAGRDDELIVERPENRRRYQVTRMPGLSNEPVISVREVGR
jgi:hypothetical protein